MLRADRTFDMLLGDEVAPRKKFIYDPRQESPQRLELILACPTNERLYE